MKLYIKYMVSQRCQMLVKEELKNLGVESEFVVVDLGVVQVMRGITPEQQGALKENLLNSGLEVLDTNKSKLIDRIINLVIEVTHHTDELRTVKYSEYLSDKLKYDYTYLANIFSEVKGMTIQQFIIIQKIERAKELLLYDELNLSEIANMLQYSSVSHLSTQFKKITGLTPTFYKELKQKRKSLLYGED